MFLRSRNSMKLFFILFDASGRQKSKMATHKQEILMFVSRHVGFLTWLASQLLRLALLSSTPLQTLVLPLEFSGYDVYRLRYKYFRFISHHLGFLISACIAQYRKQLQSNTETWKHVGLGSSVGWAGRANLCVRKRSVRPCSRPADSKKFPSVRN